MKYKAVIFDLDGLIADTEIIESRSFIKLLQENGLQPKIRSNGLVHIIGGTSTYFEDFKIEYKLENSVEEIKHKKRAYFAEIIKEEGITAYPGFFDLLNLLKEENFKIALASNRSEQQVHLILETLEIKHYFHNILGFIEGRKRKPSPDIYLNTANAMGLSPNECVVLEDTEMGVVSGKDAGMKVVAVPNIYTKNEDFSKADIVVSSLLEVNKDLLKMI